VIAKEVAPPCFTKNFKYMKNYNEVVSDEQINRTMQALEGNGIKVYVVETGEVLPLESERARKAYGVPGSFVSKLLIINKEIFPDRATVIIVKESLGF